MNDIYIITTYVIINEMMDKLDHKDHVLAHFTDAEILTVVVLLNIFKIITRAPCLYFKEWAISLNG